MTPDKLISWQALEYEHRERSVDWFWALGIVALTGAVISFLLENFLFGVFILVGAFVLALYAVRKPHILYFELNDKGVVIGKRLFPYETLDSFWVEDRFEGREPKLFFTSKKAFVPHLIIPLSDMSPSQIREFLSSRVEEKEQFESLAHKFLEFFGL